MLENIETCIGLVFLSIFPITSIVLLILVMKGNVEIGKIERVKRVGKNVYKREIPNKKNTAVGVALLMYKLRNITYMDFANVLFRTIQATILELNLRGFIDIYEDENKQTILRLIEKDIDELTSTQYVILKYISNFIDENKEIEVKELKRQMGKNKDLYRKTFGEHFVMLAIEEQKDLGNCEKDTIVYEKSKNFFILSFIDVALIIFILFFCVVIASQGTSFIATIMSAVMSAVLIFAVILMIIILSKMLEGRKNLNYTERLDYSFPGASFADRVIERMITGKSQVEYKARNRFTILTTKGKIEREEWRALKNCLEQYTLIKDHETESIVINEEYLVYATVFGIADKVQDELGKFKPLVLYNY